MSLGELCDDNCIITLNTIKLKVCKNNKIIMQGVRNQKYGLWDMPIIKNSAQNNVNLFPIHAELCNVSIKNFSKTAFHHSIQPRKKKPKILKTVTHRNHKKDDIFDAALQELHTLNFTIRKRQTCKELAQYLYAAFMSPTLSTFIKTIQNNNFISWTGLTTSLISKHLPKSIATAQGYLISKKQGLKSIKKKVNIIQDNTMFLNLTC